jgi:hypothetical protein
MKTEKEILNLIIPPIKRADGKDREWHDTDEILSKLSEKELKIAEQGLIKMLKTTDDILIPQTLVKLKSKDSIPILIEKLKLITDPFHKITWASLVYELKNDDEEMEEIAFEVFKNLQFKYEIEGCIFQDLIKFKSERIHNKIREYVNHKYSLVAHHAKLALNYNGYSESHNKELKHKKWWKFWG